MIVYLDLKPENILIRGNGSAAVVDFNTAMHIGINEQLYQQRGTKNNMSPEILYEECYLFPSDVYSFGLIAYGYFSSDSTYIVIK